jgi:hypothetical protein
MNRELVMAYWQLDLPVDVTSAAAKALADGLDSPALRILAGLAGAERADIAPVLRQAAQELGMDPPTELQAALTIARSIARGIVSAEIAPYEGARRIWEVSHEADLGHRLDAFIYDASSIDDLRVLPPSAERDKRIALFEADIANAAHSLASSVDA